MLLEGLAFAGLVITLPVLAFWFPLMVKWGLLLDAAMLGTFTVLVAIRERRWDVILAFPTFYVPRFLNSVVFMWAFFVERRSRKTKWYSVARY